MSRRKNPDGGAIRPRKLPSGAVVYVLDMGMSGGKRIRKQYETKAEAKLARADNLAARERHGSALGDLSAAAIAEFQLARERLEVAGATLTEAVDFFLKYGLTREVVTVRELVSRFTAVKEEGSSARYHRQLRVSLGALARDLDARPSHEVRGEDIESWLKKNGWAPKTRNNYLGDASAMFTWGKSKGYLSLNPCEAVSKARLGDGEIGTLTADQCEAMLMAAVHKPYFIGFVILGMFGGLRPEEIQKLDWSAVDLQARTVVVSGKIAKTRRRRIVDLTENAVAWLKASGVVMEGKITGKWWDARWRGFRRSLGWKAGNGDDGLSRYQRLKPKKPQEAPLGKWPHNALRHTYASMHYAMHENEAMLQAQMGHESAAMLHRHYRALKTKAEAKRFWDLRPVK